MNDFVQNTGNFLKSLLSRFGGDIGRGAELTAGYLMGRPSDVASDYKLISPLPESERNFNPPAPTPTPQPEISFPRTTYYLPTGGLTATGTVPQSGYSAAISRELKSQIPMGTLLQLPDGRVVRVEDLTSDDIDQTLDLFYQTASEAAYPANGLMKDQRYKIMGRDTSGLKYNYE